MKNSFLFLLGLSFLGFVQSANAERWDIKPVIEYRGSFFQLSPDGKYFLSSPTTLLDSKTQAPISIELKPADVTNYEQLEYVFSSNSKYLAIIADTKKFPTESPNRLDVFDLDQRKFLRTIFVETGNRRLVAGSTKFSPDEKRISYATAATGEFFEISNFDLEQGRLSGSTKGLMNYSFGDDYIWDLESNGVYICDGRSIAHSDFIGFPRLIFPTQGPCNMSFSSKGELAFVHNGNEHGTISINGTTYDGFGSHNYRYAINWDTQGRYLSHFLLEPFPGYFFSSNVGIVDSFQKKQFVINTGDLVKGASIIPGNERVLVFQNEKLQTGYPFKIFDFSGKELAQFNLRSGSDPELMVINDQLYILERWVNSAFLYKVIKEL